MQQNNARLNGDFIQRRLIYGADVTKWIPSKKVLSFDFSKKVIIHEWRGGVMFQK